MIGQHKRRWMTAALAACVLAAAGTAMAFPPEKPFDPRPLMAEAEKKLTADKFSFIVLGDVKNRGELPRLAKLADSLHPTFALLTGDMVATGATQLYDHLAAQLGPFMRKVPTWPCVGNHELGRVEGWQMYKQFYGIKTWDFVFDFRNVRVIQLALPGAFHGDARKAPWLEQQLAAGRKAGKHLFIFQHVPPYTVGQKRPREIPGTPSWFTALCTKYGVAADFAGHDHIYYRTRRGDVTYIIQALGGAGVYYLNRRNEALPGDVYYGSRSKEVGGTLLHTPAGEKVYPKPVWMLTQIFVDGPKVTGRTVAVTGEVIDEFVIAPLPSAPASRPTADKP